LIFNLSLSDTIFVTSVTYIFASSYKNNHINGKKEKFFRLLQYIQEERFCPTKKTVTKMATV
jgi:hypothetical protein